MLHPIWAGTHGTNLTLYLTNALARPVEKANYNVSRQNCAGAKTDAMANC
jgi:hypothetical protein